MYLFAYNLSFCTCIHENKQYLFSLLRILIHSEHHVLFPSFYPQVFTCKFVNRVNVSVSVWYFVHYLLSWSHLFLPQRSRTWWSLSPWSPLGSPCRWCCTWAAWGPPPPPSPCSASCSPWAPCRRSSSQRQWTVSLSASLELETCLSVAPNPPSPKQM